MNRIYSSLLKPASTISKSSKLTSILTTRMSNHRNSNSNSSSTSNSNNSQPDLIYSELQSPSHPHSKIGYIQLNRPHARNALSKSLISSLSILLQTIETKRRTSPEGGIRVLLLGSTSLAFCAGADLVERRSMSPDAVDLFLGDLRNVFGALEGLSVPTIALVEGVALGGGLELALCCDIRILAGVAHDKSKGKEGKGGAVIGLPETTLGIIPGAGGTQRLTRLIGSSLAKDLIFSGRRIGGQEALELGIAQYLVPADTHTTIHDGDSGTGSCKDNQGRSGILQRGIQLAETYIAQSPLAITMAKKAIGNALDTPLEQGLDYERKCYEVCMESEDRQEGLRAFAEKRAPVYGRPRAKL